MFQVSKLLSIYIGFKKSSFIYTFQINIIHISYKGVNLKF